jgi:type III pantothenate kinase
MILELDCGNSFIKWRVVDSDQGLLEAVSGIDGLSVCYCRLVSVRSAEETLKLTSAIEQRFGVTPICATPSRLLAGVSNGYEDYERLGMDRWLALVGAYSIARKACIVLDLGTAVTSDFVDAGGKHLGGFICPGLPLMRSQLRTHTRRIRYDDAAAEQAHSSFLPGRSTAEAVERGCALMIRGFVATQVDVARQHWGSDFLLFITGGDAELVKDGMDGARLMPDLVFVGLALACQFP